MAHLTYGVASLILILWFLFFFHHRETKAKTRVSHTTTILPSSSRRSSCRNTDWHYLVGKEATARRWLNFTDDSEACKRFWDPAQVRSDLDAIERHQNPADCEHSRFMVVDLEPTGIGSTVHVWGMYLAHAMERGLVLVTRGSWIYTDGATCGGRSMDLGCYFVPPTSCSLSQAESGLRTDLHFRLVQDWQRVRRSLPPSFRARGYRYWKAIASAYLVRPLPWLTKLAEEEKARVFGREGMPHPITSMHVRHGDTGLEVPIVPFSRYDAMVAKNETVFLSTEDKSVIEEAGIARERRYLYSSMERLNLSPFDAVKRLGGGREGTNSLVQLLIASECDSFVGTRSSNWCMLIEELAKVRGRGLGSAYRTPAGDDMWEE